MSSNLTFYFAWVDSTDTTFSSTFARQDENIFNLDISCKENEIPRMTVEFINPRIGLLSPGRHVWAWVSMSNDNGSTFTPLFYGRLIGIPKSIKDNVIKVDFLARATDYLFQKQQVAEGLKHLPEYDPIFLDILKRDDPDAILEGYSRLYTSSRTTLEVSTSDMLEGEDGVIELPDESVYYDSVQMTLQQAPLSAVNVKAQVMWKQQYSGFFNIGSWSWPTLGSESFVSEWPRSGASIGGGYSGSISWAGIVDPFVGIASSSNAGATYNWQNTARHHEYGDVMSVSWAYSVPTMPDMTMVTTLHEGQGGLLDPFATDAGGNPAPINDPAWSRTESVGVRKFALDYAGRTAVATIGIRYDANRQRFERIDMTVVADVQNILVDPLVTEVTENITLKSGDLGTPVTDFLNWSSIAGQVVAQGTIIFPDNPRVPGQTSSQIASTGGTAGLIEPIFSNIAGDTTADGGVIWSSLGDTPPSDSMQDWKNLARVPIGTIILPRPISGAADVTALTAMGNLGFNSHGTATAKYTVYATTLGGPGDIMMQCTKAGIYGGLTIQAVLDIINQSVIAGYIYYTLAVEGIQFSPADDLGKDHVALFTLFTNPSGKTAYIAVEPGITGEFHTTFTEPKGGLTNDGTVVWQSLGEVSLPIGGSPGMTPAASFFPSDRGQQALQHLICRARAKLRRRARAVQVSMECDFESVVDISCRHSIGFNDRRLPGGRAEGKVASYSLKRDGDSMRTWAEITMGCSIGNGFSSPSDTLALGVPTYVDDVFNPGEVQVWTGSTIPLVNNVDDIGYSPPVERPVDDGITFPAHGFGDVIITSQWHGTPSTVNPANVEAYNIAIMSTLQDMVASGHATTTYSGDSVSGSFTASLTNWASLAASAATKALKIASQGSGLWYELTLKNLTNGPFSASYVVETTKLRIPQTIDLSAPSGG